MLVLQVLHLLLKVRQGTLACSELLLSLLATATLCSELLLQLAQDGILLVHLLVQHLLLVTESVQLNGKTRGLLLVCHALLNG